MSLMDLQGSLKIITARLAGRLIGYFTWTISPDPESRGLLLGLQGAWYVAPGYPRAAVKMFDESVRVLKSCGVKCVVPHHRLQGRGSGISRFFRRRGAVDIQHNFALWIGD